MNTVRLTDAQIFLVTSALEVASAAYGRIAEAPYMQTPEQSDLRKQYAKLKIATSHLARLIEAQQ